MQDSFAKTKEGSRMPHADARGQACVREEVYKCQEEDTSWPDNFAFIRSIESALTLERALALLRTHVHTSTYTHPREPTHAPTPTHKTHTTSTRIHTRTHAHTCTH